jgi:hypothetical protein
VRRAVAAAAFAIVAACGGSSSPATGGGGGAAEPGGGGDGVRTDAQLADELLSQVGDALGCPKSSSEQRAWCIAADGWARGQAGELPADPSLLVGLSLSLPEDDPVDKALEQTVHFAALGVRGGAQPLARIASMQPSDADEQKLLDPAVAGVTAVFKGESDAVALPKELRDYLADLPSAGYSARKGERGWTWKSGSTHAELRKAGTYWIAVEWPEKGDRGIFVSIFTSKLK